MRKNVGFMCKLGAEQRQMGGFIEKTHFPVPETVEYDEIIDVRSPAEFLEDHITGAVNLPVLYDAERAEVGMVYKQVSPFEARKMGAAIVSRNIAQHIETYFAKKDKSYRPLIHCWRGGQRSESMATVISNIGWHVVLIEGGYRTYRTHVIEQIVKRVEKLNFVVLNGLTGAGKTLLLKELSYGGEQVLDLEGIARHKGSVFGGDPDNPQPAQKRFESLLFDELVKFDEGRPVYIEAESAKIGRLNLPNPLWQRMKESTVVELFSSLDCRAEYLTKDYEEWLSDLDRVENTIDRLKGFHSGKLLMEWKSMARRNEWTELARSLLAEHYDRRYRPEAEKSHFQVPSEKLEIKKHDPASLRECVELIKGFQI